MRRAPALVTVAATAVVTLQNVSTDLTVPAVAMFERWIERALNGLRSCGELTIRVVDEEEGRSLNQQWRQRDYATNVMAFPIEGVESIAPDLLGDIVLCAPVIANEAVAQGKSATAHWAHLTVHGALHLLGFDHEDDATARVMEARERRVLATLDIADPYAL